MSGSVDRRFAAAIVLLSAAVFVGLLCVGCKKQLPGLSRISQQPDLIESLVISKMLKYSPGL